MLCALIMAGGKGTRFFPASTEKKPKQFLNLLGNETMIQMTVDRLKKSIDINHIFVCTSQDYNQLVTEQLPELPKNNIINEPIGRNTAPCILLSTIYINKIFPNSNIIVLPSDHKINNNNEFLSILDSAENFIKNNSKSILTIGIKPNRPETAYGYIKYLDIVKNGTHEVRKVQKFVEKPNLTDAQKYIADGSYLWNAGMFVFNSDFMLSQFNIYMKTTYELLSQLPWNDPKFNSELEIIYPKCENISFDYAIMEKSPYIYVIPSDFGWDDIGSWSSLRRYIEPDTQENILKGDVEIFNSNNNTVFSTNKKIILLNINNIFCIESDEMIVIGSLEDLSQVNELKGKIK